MLKYIKDRIQGKAPKGAKRSKHWPIIRRKHLDKYPYCQVCGTYKKVEVHHIIPFHVKPDLELEPKNLITLCEHGRFKSFNCHLLFGHLGNYRKYNRTIHADVYYWNKKVNSDTF